METSIKNFEVFLSFFSSSESGPLKREILCFVIESLKFWPLIDIVMTENN